VLVQKNFIRRVLPYIRWLTDECTTTYIRQLTDEYIVPMFISSRYIPQF
jgi:hypothetical protein